MESAKSSLLYVPASVCGRAALESLDLRSAMEQVYKPLYGDRQIEEMQRLDLEIPRAEQEVAGARGEAKSDARKALNVRVRFVRVDP